MAGMATTTLVLAGANRLRYLIVAAGTGSETATISTIGSATPDTLTDSLAGAIKALSKVVANGYGQFAAGAQTAAKAEALWESDLSVSDPSSGSSAGSKLPTAKLRITRRSGSGEWTVTSNVDTGNPIITTSIDGGGSAYLDIFVPNQIGA